MAAGSGGFPVTAGSSVLWGVASIALPAGVSAGVSIVASAGVLAGVSSAVVDAVLVLVLRRERVLVRLAVDRVVLLALVVGSPVVAAADSSAGSLVGAVAGALVLLTSGTCAVAVSSAPDRPPAACPVAGPAASAELLARVRRARVVLVAAGGCSG